MTGGRDQTIKIWDLTTGQALQTLKGHRGLIWSVACSLDGKQLASGSNDGTVKLWDLASGSATHTMQRFGYRVSAVAFSPDGMRLASGGTDERIELWDTSTGQRVLTLKGHADGIDSARSAPTANGWRPAVSIGRCESGTQPREEWFIPCRDTSGT